MRIFINRNYFLLAIVFILHCSDSTFAQQESLYSQYMFNGLVINPAYAGSYESLNLTASARKQWAGMEGAPSTQTISAHTPMKNEKVALGMILINDKIGVTSQFSVSAIYAYRILLNEHSKLSLGLQAGCTQYKSAFSSLGTRNIGDPSFSSDLVSGLIPSFGTGIYYSAKKMYLGLSVPHLINNLLRDSVVSYNMFQRRHLILTGGYVFSVHPALKIKPSMLFRATVGLPVQLDLNVNFLFKEVLWFGCSYRSNTALNFLTQIQLTNQLKIGYSYDWNMSRLTNIAGGSHEIMINYNFSFVKSKVVTPRYF